MSDLLTLGALPLTGGRDLPAAEDGSWWLEVSADGFSFGAPEAITAVVASLIRNGTDSRNDRYGNRVVSLRLRLSAADSAGLAAGERALWAEIGRPNRLSWTHPDGFTDDVPSVFWVTASSLSPLDDAEWDLDLTKRRRMSYTLSLECLPFARSSARVSTVFTPGTGSVSTVDEASALTNWALRESSATRPDVLSQVSYLGESSVKVAYSGGASPGLRASMTVAYTGTHSGFSNYVGVDVAMSGVFSGWTPTLAGYSPVASSVASTAGFLRYWWPSSYLPAGELKVSVNGSISGYTAPDFYVGKLVTSTTIPSGGALVADVPGSAPSEGAVTISRAGSPFDEAMAFSDPALAGSGYIPDVASTWGNAPDGRYVLWFKTSDVHVSGDVFSTTFAGQALRTRVTWSSSARWFPLGEVTLGGNRDGRIGISAVPVVVKNGGAVTNQNFRLFRYDDDTSLTYVRGLSSTTELVIDIPDLSRPHGGLWANGVACDHLADSWGGWAPISPPMAALWVRLGSGNAPTVTLEHYPCWQTFAGHVD